jgi:SAM-dependent methyltransferase
MSAAPWLTAHAHLLPGKGEALDVACGRGRNALWLAGRGLRVHALDRNPDAVREVNAEAAARGLAVDACVHDLEVPGGSLPRPGAWDVVVVVHYLHRALFPSLRAAVRPGGLLIYETFTRAQALRGKPANPDFLLEAGELRERLAPLEILAYREGEFGGRCLASAVARRP